MSRDFSPPRDFGDQPIDLTSADRANLRAREVLTDRPSVLVRSGNCPPDCAHCYPNFSCRTLGSPVPAHQGVPSPDCSTSPRFYSSAAEADSTGSPLATQAMASLTNAVETLAEGDLIADLQSQRPGLDIVPVFGHRAQVIKQQQRKSF